MKTTASSYTLPRRGLIGSLPSSWVPYAELMRLHRPAGVLYIYFPYLYGNLFASCVQDSTPPLHQVVSRSVLLLCIAFVARSIGCTWNDIVDRELDKQVERCRVRPLARGAISLTDALLWMAAQYLILFSIVGATTPESWSYLVPVVATGTFYPYAKRITNYAQLILGCSLTMGFLFGCTVAGVDPVRLALQSSHASIALVAFALCYVIWGMLSDIVYAMQDFKDDKKAGILTMSVRFEHTMKPLLSMLSVVQVALLLLSGWYLGAGLGFYTGSTAMALVLTVMLMKIDLASPEACWWWFMYGGLMVGGSIMVSLQTEYLARLLGSSFD